ncbi:hypothetical protein Leryth_009054 [Lithospermum erythrorhizon]|nr:hypothetical protein Leryth_009054 [Lithospermum erythrorhizon]
MLSGIRGESIRDCPEAKPIYIEDLLKNVRTQVLLKLIKPYTRIRIPFISKELNVPEKDVEDLLGAHSKYTAIDKWNTQLKSLYQTLSNRGQYDTLVPFM